MKKKLIIFTLIIIALFSLSACGIFNPKHTHDFTKNVTVPTCKEQGFTTYTCECGESYIDNYVNALGHREIIDNEVEPTCTKTGLTEGKHCSVCEEVIVEQEVVSAHGHDFTLESINQKYLLSNATCETKAVYYKSCSVCGTVSDETFEYGNALGHEFNLYEYNNDETCMLDGTETAICKRVGCNETHTRTVVGSKKHIFTNYIYNNDATCLEDGTETAICKRVGCDETHTRQSSNTSLGHYWNNGEVIEPALCESVGEMRYICLVCEQTKNVELKAVGHSLKENKVNATCNHAGYTLDYCENKNCGYREYKNMTKSIGHDGDSGNCKICGIWYTSILGEYIDNNGHSLIENLGYRMYFNVYGRRITVTHFHNNDSIEFYEEISSSVGLISSTKLTLCASSAIWEVKMYIIQNSPSSMSGSINKSIFNQNTKTLPYTSTQGNVGTPSTFNESATASVKALLTEINVILGKINEVITIKNLGFTGSFNFSQHRHNYNISTYSNPSCQNGEIQYYCSCGLQKKEKLNPIHTFVKDEIIQSNICTRQEVLIEKCTNCFQKKETILKQISHDYFDPIITDPTCDEKGYTTYICKVCGENTIDDYVNPTGHFVVNDECAICLSKPEVTEGIIYAISSDGTYASVTQYEGISQNIIVAEEYQGVPVRYINSSAFQGNNSIVSIVIPDSVIEIEKGSFKGCNSLVSITIPFVGTSSDTMNYNSVFGAIFGYDITVETTPIKDAVWQYTTGYGISTKRYYYYIPQSLRNVAVNNYRISDCAFANCLMLSNVVLGDGVNNIGEQAFYGCDALTSVVIGDSVTTISHSAFSGCSNLTSMEIPDSLTSIGYSVFEGCRKLQFNVYDNGNYLGNVNNPYFVLIRGISSSISSLTIHKNTKLIAGEACYNYERLLNLVIGDSVISIGNYAFLGCSSLTSVVIGDSVTSIGNSTFAGCSGLTSMEIPDSVTSIGDYAFNGCSGLTSIEIPDSVTFIGSSAFYNCSSLTEVVIPDSITSIGSAAFYGCPIVNAIIPAVACNSIKNTNLKTIEITSGEIPSSVFSDCSNLISVVIDDSVTLIGEGAFSGCSSLQSITIPFVGDKAGKTSNDTYQYPFGYIFGTSSYTGGTATKQYYYDSSISRTTYSTYYIPTSLKQVMVTGDNILYGAFYNCNGLTSVVLNESVNFIGQDAFYGCSSLSSIVIPNSVTSIESWAFSWCDNLTSVEIPGSVTFIGMGAFCGCSKLTDIIVSENNDNYCSIDGNIYSKDKSILIEYAPGKNEFIIPNFVIAIGDWAFSGCDKLTYAVIPNTITSIGIWAFGYCGNLISIEIPDSVTSIGYGAFGRCTSLNSIEIPNSVTVIDGSMFLDCAKLASVKLGNFVTTIGYSAFRGCSSLVFIELPDSVTSIGELAFGVCGSLTGVVISNSVTSIGEQAFVGCRSLTKVYYKGSSTEWDNITVNSGNTSLTNATRYYYSESEPTESGNYWHYDENGNVEVW